MRIRKIRIKNFRSFDDCEIDLDDYTALVGANGSGKSTVLCALQVFFREQETAATNILELDAEDFHNRNTKDPVEITVTFGNLSDNAKADFADYFRQDQLVLSARAEFDAERGCAVVKQSGQRLAMPEFAAFFRAYNDGRSAGECKAVYEEIRNLQVPELPKAGSKDVMHEALRAYEEAHPDKCKLLRSDDQLYGFTKGANRLARHIQWIFLPAIKDVTKENVETKNTALGKILARTVRAKVRFDDEIETLKNETQEKYRKLMDAQQGALTDLSKSLSQRLAQFAHSDTTARVAWVEDEKKSVQIDEPSAKLFAGEGEFEGELARFGHGLQRSYLLALLQELASAEDAAAPTLVLGIEEPELFQHPPQARYLADVLEQLSAGNSQVLLCSHSPYFISGRQFECVRMVRREPAAKRSSVGSVTYQTLADRIAALTGEKPNKPQAQMARLQQALQPHLTEMFFASRVVFVEGIEDMAYLTSWLVLTNRWTDFRRFGAHFVAVNGKSYFLEPLVIAEQLQIPSLTIFDADGDKLNVSERQKHERDNKAILTFLGGDPANHFPNGTVWNSRFVQWPSNLGATLKAEVDGGLWDKTYGQASKGLGNPEGSFAKNPIHIGMHLELLQRAKAVPPSLEALTLHVLQFSKS